MREALRARGLMEAYEARNRTSAMTTWDSQGKCGETRRRRMAQMLVDRTGVCI